MWGNNSVGIVTKADSIYNILTIFGNSLWRKRKLIDMCEAVYEEFEFRIILIEMCPNMWPFTVKVKIQYRDNYWSTDTNGL